MKQLQALRERWQWLANRIDGMTLRERVFLFISISLVMAAVLDSMVISPMLSEQKVLRQAQQKHAGELKVMREQFAQARQLSASDSPEGRLRNAVNSAQTEQQALDQQLKQNSGLVDNSSQLPDVLGRLLKQHPGLTLVKLNTMDGTAMSAALSGNTSNSKLKWRGVELRVAGNYLDLMNYLAELERTLPALRWGELRIGSEDGRALMQVQVFLVGDIT